MSRARHNPAEQVLKAFKPRLDVLSAPRIEKAPDDHWDGRHFHNTDNHQPHGPWQALHWLVSRRPARWPSWIEQTPSQPPLVRLSEDIADVQVTFVNHATVLLQVGPWNLLTDPVWSDFCSPIQGLGPRRVRAPGVALADLPPIHAVLLSHDHYDHLDMRTLMWLAARDRPLIITGLGVDACLRAQGLTHVVALDWWQTVRVGPLTVHFLPAQHFSGRGARDRNRTLWGSLWVTAGERSVYFGGDTGYGPHFADIRQRLGSPTLALLPIGAYAPRWFMQSVHMNPEDAVQAHIDLAAEQSLAIHFNTFQLTDEAIDEPVQQLRLVMSQRQLPLDQFVVLQEGAAWRL